MTRPQLDPATLLPVGPGPSTTRSCINCNDHWATQLGALRGPEGGEDWCCDLCASHGTTDEAGYLADLLDRAIDADASRAQLDRIEARLAVLEVGRSGRGRGGHRCGAQCDEATGWHGGAL